MNNPFSRVSNDRSKKSKKPIAVSWQDQAKQVYSKAAQVVADVEVRKHVMSACTIVGNGIFYGLMGFIVYLALVALAGVAAHAIVEFYGVAILVFGLFILANWIESTLPKPAAA